MVFTRRQGSFADLEASGQRLWRRAPRRSRGLPRLPRPRSLSGPVPGSPRARCLAWRWRPLGGRFPLGRENVSVGLNQPQIVKSNQPIPVDRNQPIAPDGVDAPAIELRYVTASLAVRRVVWLTSRTFQY